MGICREFTADITSNGGFTGTQPTTKVTAAGWVLRNIADTNIRGIAGQISGNNGWAFYTFGITDLLAFNARNGGLTAGVFTITVPNIRTQWTFIAVTYDSVAGEVKFYTGTNPSNIAQFDTTKALSTPMGTVGGAGTMLGKVNGATLGSIGFDKCWQGRMDNWGCWFEVILTLAELKTHATCGGSVRPSDAIWLCPIIGVDPEPITYSGGSSTMFFTDTTIITGTLTGCDPSSDVPKGSNPTIQKPPTTSGGPGGGLNVPTQTYDLPGGPGGSAGDVGLPGGRSFEEPDYGQNIKVGKMGSRQGISVEQSGFPRYFDLNHLAAKLRAKK